MKFSARRMGGISLALGFGYCPTPMINTLDIWILLWRIRIQGKLKDPPQEQILYKGNGIDDANQLARALTGKNLT